jgi:stage V sporulation protein D (sporulation-specific penicillin-binding protein)
MIAEEIKKETIVKVPEVRNLPLEDAKRVLNNTGLNYIIEGEGTMVIEQTPKTNAQITIGSNVILYLGEELVPRENQEVTVPDIEGKTMREAAEILSAMGLKLSPTGSGIAVKQSPAPGSKMTVGMTIYVTFEPRL